VFPDIHQDVDQRVSNRPRRRQHARVIPIPPHGAVSAECAVDCPCNADGEPAETSPEALPIVGLDDQMQVIVLHTEM